MRGNGSCILGEKAAAIQIKRGKKMQQKDGFYERIREQKRDRALFDQANEMAWAYQQKDGEQRVFPNREALEGLTEFDIPLPERGRPVQEALALLQTRGEPAAVRQSEGRYFGFVNGGALPAALLARRATECWDQNAALYVMSPIAAELERIAGEWMTDLLGIPQETAMGLVPGSANAIFCALVTARNAQLKRLGYDEKEKGLFSAPKLRVVLGEQAHATVFAALYQAGFGREQMVVVPVREDGRLYAEDLPQLRESDIVIAQAGNVANGCFDEIEGIAARCQEAGAWLHIDGAFGLWAGASKRKRHLVKGMERADSLSCDGHKTLNLPYDCAMVFCRQEAQLTDALSAEGSYIAYTKNRDGMRYSQQMSRRAYAIELWAALYTLGKEGVEALVDRLCEGAEYCAERLKAEGFCVPYEVVFNQVLVCCKMQDITRRTLEFLQQSGVVWCGGMNYFGRDCIRISVCSWETTHADIDLLVRTLVDCRRRAEEEFLARP